MIRAASKNFENVIVIVKPQRYSQILDEWKRNGEISYKTKKSLAIEALKEIAKHDKTIYKFLEKI
jgi:phosphoribosylaminoimidazolecarboxamide formyltransferase/IMP cyclohydrolase